MHSSFVKLILTGFLLVLAALVGAGQTTNYTNFAAVGMVGASNVFSSVIA
jgi:hypothetical protein